ncbi:MAG: ABC transporter permease [Chloroflexota bacterium]|nr:ABC transporter permease [Chloroflexota bacterium]
MNMRVYVLRRLLQGALTLLLVSIAIFAAVRAAPGDAADLIAAGGAETALAGSESERAAIRADLGLDRPLWRQYATWLSDMVTLDWGESFVSGRSVWAEFLRRLPVTLQLSIMGIAVAVGLGVPLGVAAALRQDTWVDYAVRVFALGGVSLPHFWLATLVLLAGVRYFTWSPPPGYQPFVDEPGTNLVQFIWPALVLGYSGAGLLTRMTRYAVLEVMRQEYVRTAHAKGLYPGGVVSRHILRNALLPVITVAGIAFATLISGSVVLEQVFTLPGTGLYLLDAVKLRDYAVVQPVIVFFAAWVVVVNLAVDMLYTWLNPQVRYA